jgi:hypothetical protein
MDQRKISYFIAAIIFIIALFYAIRGYASEGIYEYEWPNPQLALLPSQSREFREKKNYHQNLGIQAFERAHEKFWWLPRISDRALARSCFTTTMTTVTATTPQSKIMAALVNIFVTYGLAAMDEWDYINYNLADAKYNFEMMEFYNDVLNKA